MLGGNLLLDDHIHVLLVVVLLLALDVLHHGLLLLVPGRHVHLLRLLEVLVHVKRGRIAHSFRQLLGRHVAYASLASLLGWFELWRKLTVRKDLLAAIIGHMLLLGVLRHGELAVVSPDETVACVVHLCVIQLRRLLLRHLLLLERRLANEHGLKTGHLGLLMAERGHEHTWLHLHLINVLGVCYLVELRSVGPQNSLLVITLGTMSHLLCHSRLTVQLI